MPVSINHVESMRPPGTRTRVKNYDRYALLKLTLSLGIDEPKPLWQITRMYMCGHNEADMRRVLIASGLITKHDDSRYITTAKGFEIMNLIQELHDLLPWLALKDSSHSISPTSQD